MLPVVKEGPSGSILEKRNMLRSNFSDFYILPKARGNISSLFIGNRLQLVGNPSNFLMSALLRASGPFHAEIFRFSPFYGNPRQYRQDLTFFTHWKRNKNRLLYREHLPGGITPGWSAGSTTQGSLYSKDFTPPFHAGRSLLVRFPAPVKSWQ